MFIKRPRYLEKLIRYKDKDLIKVITGVRRCGKSVLLFEIYYDYLLKNKVDEKNIIKINLENQSAKNLRDADNLYRYISKLKSNNKKMYVFIDEIQYVENFEDVVNSLKNEGCDVYITGSNAHLLSSDIATSLRGRSIEIKVFPLTFSEYYSSTNKDKNSAFNEYIEFGGFPYIWAEESKENKIEYLQMLESTIASKDIIERYKLKKDGMFSEVYNFLCSNIGCTVSAKKISDTLKSNGYKSITPDTISSYLNYLCESFLFYKVYRYDIKGKEYLKTQNKYYICDVGLRNAHINFRQTEFTHIIENIVYLELISRGYKVDIGKNKEKEIDFIAKSASDLFYIQVCYSIIEKSKEEQELSSFYKLDDGYRKIVITCDNTPFTLLKNGYKKLNIIDFLLDEKALETI